MHDQAATTSNWLTNYAVSASFLTISSAIGKPAVFLLLAGFCAAGTVWLHSALPETSGKTLEEIEGLFGLDPLSPAAAAAVEWREGATPLVGSEEPPAASSVGEPQNPWLSTLSDHAASKKPAL